MTILQSFQSNLSLQASKHSNPIQASKPPGLEYSNPPGLLLGCCNLPCLGATTPMPQAATGRHRLENLLAPEPPKTFKIDEIQLESMKLDGNQRNPMKINEIQLNLMRFDEIQWKSMKFNEIRDIYYPRNMESSDIRILRGRRQRRQPVNILPMNPYILPINPYILPKVSTES